MGTFKQPEKDIGRKRLPRPSRRSAPRPRRESPRPTSADKNRPQQYGLFARFTGRADLERFKENRYKPYRFESNAGLFKWLLVLVCLWVVVNSVAAGFEYSKASTYTEWRAAGQREVPPRSFVLASAWGNFADCNPNDIISQINDTSSEIPLSLPAETPCERFVYWSRFSTSEDSTAAFLFFNLPLGLALVLVFGHFAYRASRNLLTLNSAGQRHRPEMTILWLYVPLMNFFQPYRSFTEMFAASDPGVTPKDDTAWRSKRGLPPVVALWQVAIIVIILVNPITVYRIWGPLLLTGSPIDVLIGQTWWSFTADVILAVTGLLTLVIALLLHARQEARFDVVGEKVVTPATPIDELENQIRKEENR